GKAHGQGARPHAGRGHPLRVPRGSGPVAVPGVPGPGGPAHPGAPVAANHAGAGGLGGSAAAARGRGRRPTGSQGQPRTGASPPCGSAGGPAETWTMVERGPHLAYRKSESWKRSTYSRARRRSIPTFHGKKNGGMRPIQGEDDVV